MTKVVHKTRPVRCHICFELMVRMANDAAHSDDQDSAIDNPKWICQNPKCSINIAILNGCAGVAWRYKG